MKARIIFLQIIILLPMLAFAQALPKDSAKYPHYFSLALSYQNGYIFATNKFLKGSNIEAEKINAFQAFSVKFSKQTIGKKLWQQLYKYPSYGIGFNVFDFYNPEEIGTPFAIYGFFQAPFKRWDRITFNYEIGFGATFNWRSFDPINNKYNIAIGAGESFFIVAGLNFQYHLTKKIDLEAGFLLTHFSNGALKRPNYGINTVGLNLSVKYNFNNAPVFIKQEVKKYKKENELLVSVFGSQKNVIFDSVNINIIEKYEGVNFLVFGVSTTFNRQISYKSKIGIGMSFSYNGAVNAQAAVNNNELEPVNGSHSDKIQLSIYPSYELVINRVSLILQPAFYLYRKKFTNQTPIFYQKIGLKYHFAENFFVGITLRDYKFHVSDFVEWNIGYRIKWK